MKMQTIMQNSKYSPPIQLDYGPTDTFQDLLITDDHTATFNANPQDVAGELAIFTPTSSTETNSQDSPPDKKGIGDHVMLGGALLKAKAGQSPPPSIEKLKAHNTTTELEEAQQNFEDIITVKYSIRTMPAKYNQSSKNSIPLIEIDPTLGTLKVWTNTVTRGHGSSPEQAVVIITAKWKYIKKSGQASTEPGNLIQSDPININWSLVNAHNHSIKCVLGNGAPVDKDKMSSGLQPGMYQGADYYHYYTQLYVSNYLQPQPGITRPLQTFAEKDNTKNSNQYDLPKWADAEVFGLKYKLVPPHGGFSNKGVTALSSGQVAVPSYPETPTTINGNVYPADAQGTVAPTMLGKRTLNSDPKQTHYETGILQVWALKNTINNKSSSDVKLCDIDLSYSWYEYYDYWYNAYVETFYKYDPNGTPMALGPYTEQVKSSFSGSQAGSTSDTHHVAGVSYGKPTPDKWPNIDNDGIVTNNAMVSVFIEDDVDNPTQEFDAYGDEIDYDDDAEWNQMREPIRIISAKAAASSCNAKMPTPVDAGPLANSLSHAAAQMGMRSCDHTNIQMSVGTVLGSASAGSDHSVGCSAWALSASNFNETNKTVSCLDSEVNTNVGNYINQSLKFRIIVGDMSGDSSVTVIGKNKAKITGTVQVDSTTAQKLLSTSTTNITTKSTNTSKELGGWGSPQSGAKSVKVVAQNLNNLAETSQVHKMLVNATNAITQSQSISFQVGNMSGSAKVDLTLTNNATIVSSIIASQTSALASTASNSNTVLDELKNSLTNKGTGPIQDEMNGLAKVLSSLMGPVIAIVIVIVVIMMMNSKGTSGGMLGGTMAMQDNAESQKLLMIGGGVLVMDSVLFLAFKHLPFVKNTATNTQHEVLGMVGVFGGLILAYALILKQQATDLANKGGGKTLKI